MSLAVLLVGALVWCGSLVQIVAWGGRRAGSRLLRVVDAFSDAILGWFGIRLLWSGLQKIRPVAAPPIRVVV